MVGRHEYTLCYAASPLVHGNPTPREQVLHAGSSQAGKHLWGTLAGRKAGEQAGRQVQRTSNSWASSLGWRAICYTLYPTATQHLVLF